MTENPKIYLSGDGKIRAAQSALDQQAARITERTGAEWGASEQVGPGGRVLPGVDLDADAVSSAIMSAAAEAFKASPRCSREVREHVARYILGAAIELIV